MKGPNKNQLKLKLKETYELYCVLLYGSMQLKQRYFTFIVNKYLSIIGL